MKVDVDSLLNEKDEHKDIYEYLTNPLGEIYEEFNKIHEFDQELKNTKRSKT